MIKLISSFFFSRRNVLCSFGFIFFITSSGTAQRVDSAFCKGSNNTDYFTIPWNCSQYMGCHISGNAALFTCPRGSYFYGPNNTCIFLQPQMQGICIEDPDGKSSFTFTYKNRKIRHGFSL